MQAILPRRVVLAAKFKRGAFVRKLHGVQPRLASTTAVQTPTGPSKERLLLEKIAKRDGFHWTDANRWYSLSLDKFSNKAEKDLLEKYDNNLYQALLDHFPSVQLVPWRFPGGAVRCLSDPVTRRLLLEYLRDQLDIKDAAQWRTRLSSARLKQLGVIVPLKSLKMALAEEYPTTDWSSVFGSPVIRNRGFAQHEVVENLDAWKSDDLNKTRAAFEQLHHKLNLPAGLAGWYRVTSKQLGMNPVVQAFVAKNAGSLFLALKSLYPAHAWQEWRLGSVPRNFWGNPANCARFFKHMVPDDLSRWYSIGQEEVKQIPGGAGLLAHYGGLPAALASAFPDHKWELWKFPKPGAAVVANKDLHRPYLDEVSKNLGITSLDQCIAQMLVSNYPEHTWDVWRLPAPGDWWTQPDTARRFLESEAKRIGVNSLEDWYFVKNNLSVRSPGFDLKTALEIAYPSHTWESWRFGSKKWEWSPTKQPRRQQTPKAAEPPPTAAIPETHSADDPKRLALRALYQKVMGTV